MTHYIKNINNIQQYFNIFDNLHIYCWIGSGAVRDTFIGVQPNDIDIFFPDQESKSVATRRLTEIKAKKVRTLPRGERFNYNEVQYDLICWDGTGDPPCLSKTPEETIKWFDYTVEMAALDINGKFYSYPTFYDDIANKRLIRNPLHRLQDLYPRLNNTRLLKYIKNGYTIDTDNLLLFLEDQDITFEYRQRRNQEKLKKDK